MFEWCLLQFFGFSLQLLRNLWLALDREWMSNLLTSFCQTNHTNWFQVPEHLCTAGRAINLHLKLSGDYTEITTNLNCFVSEKLELAKRKWSFFATSSQKVFHLLMPLVTVIFFNHKFPARPRQSFLFYFQATELKRAKKWLKNSINILNESAKLLHANLI